MPQNELAAAVSPYLLQQSQMRLTEAPLLAVYFDQSPGSPTPISTKLTVIICNANPSTSPVAASAKLERQRQGNDSQIDDAAEFISEDLYGRATPR
jgi:hypothetical protein